MKRRRKLLVLVGLVAVAAIFVWRLFRVHGFVVALAAVDGRRAVVCVRANEEWGLGPRAWVGLLELGHGWIWSARLAGLPVVGARNGLLVEDGVVIVRTERATTGYSLDGGRRLWRRDFGGKTENSASSYVDLVAAPPRVVQATRGRGDLPGALTALDARSGATAWEHASRRPGEDVASAGSPQVIGASFVTSDVFSITLWPLAGGAPRKLDADGPAFCVDHGDLVYMTGGRVEAVAPSGDLPPRVVVPSLAFPSGTTAFATACGRYRDHLLFSVILQRRNEDEGALLEIDPVAGTQVRLDALGTTGRASVVQGRIDAMFPAAAPLEGDLTRFVPLVLDASEHQMQLAILDLDERRVVRRGPSSDERLFTSIVKDGAVYYVFSGPPGDDVDLARFDGATGRITAAVHLPPIESQWLGPDQIRGGAVWVYVGRWVDPLPIAALDATTLAPVAGSALPVVGAVTALLPD